MSTVLPLRQSQAILELAESLRMSRLADHLATASHLNYRGMEGVNGEVVKACSEALRIAEALCKFVKAMTPETDLPATLTDALDAAEAILKRSA